MTTSASATRFPEAEISGAHAVRQLDMGLAHVAAGRIDEAIAAYQRGVAENGPPVAIRRYLDGAGAIGRVAGHRPAAVWTWTGCPIVLCYAGRGGGENIRQQTKRPTHPGKIARAPDVPEGEPICKDGFPGGYTPGLFHFTGRLAFE